MLGRLKTKYGSIPILLVFLGAGGCSDGINYQRIFESNWEIEDFVGCYSFDEAVKIRITEKSVFGSNGEVLREVASVRGAGLGKEWGYLRITDEIFFDDRQGRVYTDRSEPGFMLLFEGQREDPVLRLINRRGIIFRLSKSNCSKVPELETSESASPSVL